MTGSAIPDIVHLSVPPVAPCIELELSSVLNVWIVQDVCLHVVITSWHCKYLHFPHKR